MQEQRKRDDVQREYANDEILIRWEPDLCVHIARCLMRLPKVFNARAKPWIDVNGAEADEIARTVMECPTGALHFQRLDGGPQEEPPAETIIEPRPDGPLAIRGKLRIRRADGTVREDTRVALCRCGQSQNKPFCDGAHSIVRFKAPGVD